MAKISEDDTAANPWQFLDFTLVVQDVGMSLLSIDHIGDSVSPFDGKHELLKLPDLETFQYGPLEDISCISDSTTSETQSTRDEEDDSHDIWTAILFDQYDASKHVRSWEQVENKSFQEPQLYLSEASQAVWNSAWATFRSGKTVSKPAVEHDLVIRCLVDVGVGLNNSLFAFDVDGHAFLQEEITFSGLSPDLSLSIVRKIGDCGKSIRTIEAFTDSAASQVSASRATNAVVSIMSRTLGIIRQQIIFDVSQAYTILQVQQLYEKPSAILGKLATLVEGLRQHPEEYSLINHLLKLVNDHESRHDDFYPIAFHLLRQATQPFLEDASNAIGLPLGSLVAHRTQPLPLAGVQETDFLHSIDSGEWRLPNILDSDQKRMVRQMQQSLKLLTTHRPDHSLIDTVRCHSKDNVVLELASSWADIEDLQGKATKYENDMIRAMLKDPGQRHNAADSPLITDTHVQLDDTSLEPAEFDIKQSITECNKVPQHDDESDGLLSATVCALDGRPLVDMTADHQIPLVLLITESFSPLLSIQSRLVNHACLRMVFNDGNLLHNLDIMYEYHLLGSGLFATKLKQALFSPELATAEREKGRYRKGQLGLRLGSRSAWPPASAELRLALMGILSECYQAFHPVHAMNFESHLPGNLAFAIRNLTEPEIEACMDPHALEALDFLRLQFHPDHALEAIFTESILSKYDLIFKFLLRLSRISFEIDQLWTKQRASRIGVDSIGQRFSFEARHFVQTIAAYVHSTISTTWRAFHAIVASIEKQLNEDLNTKSLSGNVGLHSLRSLHDMMLDKLMFDLLLRSRQESLMQMLNEVLAHVLQVASSDSCDAQTISDFRIKTQRFVDLCHDFSEHDDHAHQDERITPDSFGKAWSKFTNADPGLKSLILVLDANGWYSQTRA